MRRGTSCILSEASEETGRIPAAKKVVLFCVHASYGRVEEIGEGESRLKKRKLNYRFHNANEPELFLKLLLEVLIEANRKKVEDAIREYSDKQEKEETRAEMCI